MGLYYFHWIFRSSCKWHQVVMKTNVAGWKGGCRLKKRWMECDKENVREKAAKNDRKKWKQVT